MTSRRNQLLKKLIGKGTGEDEAKLYKLTIERICADDLNKKDMEGAADVMKQAIVRAEKLDPDKEALFIIQDAKEMSLVHYKIDSEGASFKQMWKERHIYQPRLNILVKTGWPPVNIYHT